MAPQKLEKKLRMEEKVMKAITIEKKKLCRNIRLGELGHIIGISIVSYGTNSLP
jgi:hypothetical protein